MKKFICSICNKEFRNQSALNAHAVAHAPKQIFTCSVCGKTLKTTPGSFKHHLKYCNDKKENNINDFNKHVVCYCKFCNKECHSKNSLKQHELRCKQNVNHIPISTPENFNAKGLIPWNAGLDKTDPRVAKQAAACSMTLKGRSTHPQSKETKDILRSYALERGLGGFNMRKKGIVYNNIKLDSTYEVEVAKSLDENNINWIRPKRIPYHYADGSLHYYTPDFYLSDYDMYLDPKNDYLIEHVNEFTGMTDVEKNTTCYERA